MTDKGTVEVGTDGVSFAGDKGSVDIDYATMKVVSLGKVGADWINNWVMIRYQRGNVESYALFSGGKALGWGGRGVAAQIFQALDFALQQRGLDETLRHD